MGKFGKHGVYAPDECAVSGLPLRGKTFISQTVSGTGGVYYSYLCQYENEGKALREALFAEAQKASTPKSKASNKPSVKEETTDGS